MDDPTLMFTLMFHLPIGLLTLFQVVEAGRRVTWRSRSRAPSPPPEGGVTNGNARRDAWVQNSRSCASLSLL